jgi:hypothetical protein
MNQHYSILNEREEVSFLILLKELLYFFLYIHNFTIHSTQTILWLNVIQNNRVQTIIRN